MANTFFAELRDNSEKQVRRRADILQNQAMTYKSIFNNPTSSLKFMAVALGAILNIIEDAIYLSLGLVAYLTTFIHNPMDNDTNSRAELIKEFLKHQIGLIFIDTGVLLLGVVLTIVRGIHSLIKLGKGPNITETDNNLFYDSFGELDEDYDGFSISEIDTFLYNQFSN